MNTGAWVVVEVGELVEPPDQRGPPGVVGRDRTEPRRHLDHRPADMAGEGPEHVLLAGEVLVEGGPRASRRLGDLLDAAVVVAVLGEHPQRRGQDAALGSGSPLTDDGVVAERRASLDLDAVDHQCNLPPRIGRTGQAGTPSSSPRLPPMILADVVAARGSREIVDELERLGEPFGVREVGAEQHPFAADGVDQLAQPVLPERVDVDVAVERGDRVLGELAGASSCRRPRTSR